MTKAGAWPGSVGKGASRREVLAAAGLCATVVPVAGRAADISGLRAAFPVAGTYFDAAFAHPLPTYAAEAAIAYTRERLRSPQAAGPRRNPRDLAVSRFAALVNVASEDVAVVPSTMGGENLLCAALGLGRQAGVLTDTSHYDASLVLYGELARRGVPVAIVAPGAGGIDLAEYRRHLTPATRLIAISLVSSTTGLVHDLAGLCEMAHARGVLVYADIIQAAGAMPVDLKASGVDFAGCGTYKWLMGEYGAAFLYVRPDRLALLRRTEVGWRQLRRQTDAAHPATSPDPAIEPYTLRTDAVGLFEVSTPSWQALAIVAASLDGIARIGVDAIVRHREPLIARLRSGLAEHGFQPLAPATSGPVLSFAVTDAARRFTEPLAREGITVSLYDQRIRIAPSIYNSMDDVEHLIATLAAN